MSAPTTRRTLARRIDTEHGRTTFTVWSEAAQLVGRFATREDAELFVAADSMLTDLLAASREALERLEEMRRHPDTCDMLRAAIAKATGQADTK